MLSIYSGIIILICFIIYKTIIIVSERENIIVDWNLAEMDADHVAAWSKGGATDTKNCQMLCKTHNRAKGNR